MRSSPSFFQHTVHSYMHCRRILLLFSNPYEEKKKKSRCNTHIHSPRTKYGEWLGRKKTTTRKENDFSENTPLIFFWPYLGETGRRSGEFNLYSRNRRTLRICNYKATNKECPKMSGLQKGREIAHAVFLLSLFHFCQTLGKKVRNLTFL